MISKHQSTLILIISIIFYLIGCDQPNSTGENDSKYSVLFNLVVNQGNQELYIYYTSLNESNRYNIKDYFVNGAIIEIKSSNLTYNSFKIQEVLSNPWSFSKGNYYTNINELLLLPATFYNIEIKIEDKVIMGTTTTPDDFDILEPFPNSVFSYKDKMDGKNINISWSKSSTAFGYTGKLINEYNFALPDTTYHIIDERTFITQDTNFIIRNENVSLNKGDLEIIIYAFDENFYSHHIEMFTKAGIDGSYGYVGSSVRKSISIFVK